MFQFPASPTIGQVFAPGGGPTYKWNGKGWAPFSSVYDGGLTFTAPVLFADGMASAPGIAFAGATGTGIYRDGTAVGHTINGALVFAATDEWVLSGKQHLFQDGVLNVPGISWFNEASSGIFRSGANAFQSVVGGNWIWAWNAVSFSVNNGVVSYFGGASTFVGQAKFANGTVGAPGISWVNDPDSGWYKDPVGGHIAYSVDGSAKFAIKPTSIVSAAQHQFSDGVLAAPGIGWAGETNSGFMRGGTGWFRSIVNGASVHEWTGTQFQVVIPFTASSTATIAGLLQLNNKLNIDRNGSGVSNGYTQGSIVINSSGGGFPSIGFHEAGIAGWSIGSISGYFQIGEGSGPGTLSGWAMRIDKPGNVTARAFYGATLLATNAQPMTGALLDVLKLRGVRYIDTETQKPSIQVEVDDGVFPELVDTLEGGGRAINYGALAAPIIEAIRELNERLIALEAK